MIIDISLSHYLTYILPPDLSSVYWRWLPYEKNTVPTDLNDKVVRALPSSTKASLKPVMTASNVVSIPWTALLETIVAVVNI